MGETSEVHEGGCLCGRVRYRVAGGLGPAAHCHCRSCRRASGALAVTWITVPLARFAFTRGEPADLESSPGVVRRFCPTCGSPLTYWNAGTSEDVDVTVATLDAPENARVEFHVWTSHRLPELHLDEHLPGYPEFKSVR